MRVPSVFCFSTRSDLPPDKMPHEAPMQNFKARPMVPSAQARSYM